ncbi:MAG: TldD/PmbA family protein [Candidatus Nanohaloarchaea archaeon]|nr:TldD/PmbA family protein [Candidatus Nanohaloarchaea archaeon]
MRDMLEDALDTIQQQGADYADVRYERFDTTKLEVKDRKLEEIATGNDTGVGFRAFYNGAWGFASTNDLESLEDAASDAIRSAKALAGNSSTESRELAPAPQVDETIESQASIPPDFMEMEEKVAILEDAERTMRFSSDKIRSANVIYRDSHGTYMFLNSQGSFVEKHPTHYSLYCQATAKSGGDVETHMERSASIRGMEHFQEADPVSLGEKAAEMAIKIVEAPRPPTGKMPVIIGDRLGGLFAHEAVGHAAEADTVQSGNSIFQGQKGETIAAEGVTVVDDPTLEGKHGSYRFDDEGVPARETTIIADGTLEGFMHSRDTAARAGVEPTGNARAESFAERPVVRMSNTYFAEGDSSKEEMIETIDDGLYVKGFKGGQVSTAEGNFTFGTTHAERIEDGERTGLVRGPSISGMTLDILQRIELVGGDVSVGDPGYCGKNGQTVYVDTGSPHMKVDRMVVG